MVEAAAARVRFKHTTNTTNLQHVFEQVLYDYSSADIALHANDRVWLGAPSEDGQWTTVTTESGVSGYCPTAYLQSD